MPRGQIGRYEILRELGRGGMATVYLARQPDLERLVALKELASFGSQDPHLVHRFLREAHISGSLSDPNIVTVYESFVADGVPHISMEYLRRGSLRPLVHMLEPMQVVMVLHDILAGLSAAEKQHVVHRDLKPENLLITEERHVKIADFGIAKALDRTTTMEFKTATGMTVGTPAYIAPEQALGQDITPATDLYSVGVMAYEMLAGRLPFTADTPIALIMKHVNDAPPPPLLVNPELEPQLGAWIERMLVKDPKDRTQTAAQAWDELEDIAIALRGPRWRRDALLPAATEPAEDYYTVAGAPPPRPSTSEIWGPLEGGGADTSPGPFTPPPGPTATPMSTPPVGPPTPVPVPQQQYTPPPPLAAPAVTVPPQTPPPGYYTPAPVEPPPRRGPRLVMWLLVLAFLATGAAAAALVLRPDDTPSPSASASATPTGAAATGGGGPQRFVTSAYSVDLPAGWEQQCSEQAVCNKARLDAGGKRSAFSKGSGKAGAGTTIDHYDLAGGLALDRLADSQEQTLNRLAGYVRTGDGTVRTMTPRPGRDALTFSFRLKDPNERFGTVIVFKDGKDAYVITTTAADAKTADEAAETVAGSLEPQA